MPQNSHSHYYDIIVLGGGIAGSSLLYRFLKTKAYDSQRILFIDRDFSSVPHKLISFWNDKSAWFDEFVVKEWTSLSVVSAADQTMQLDRGAFAYKSIDAYLMVKKMRAYIQSCNQVKFLNADIKQLQSDENRAEVLTDKGLFTGGIIFNTVIADAKADIADQNFIQHFKGYMIRQEEDIDAQKATIMDFRTSQEYGTCFFYCLPFSSRNLFVEYTVFSKTLLTDEAYNTAINTYLKNVLGISNYKIISEESGQIPMSNVKLMRYKNRIFTLGGAGGDIRSSTGYMFLNTQKVIDQIVAAKSYKSLINNFKPPISARHQFYDAILLNVLARESYKGHQLFSDLFARASAFRVFRFLNSESTFLDEISIMMSLRYMPFIRQLVNVCRQSFRKQYRFSSKK